jgi:hypothetical protein
MTRHLATCWSDVDAGNQNEVGQLAPLSKVYHLLVEGFYAPRYWLHLEVPSKFTLDALDDFLRAIWLECCGHLSAFEAINAYCIFALVNLFQQS